MKLYLLRDLLKEHEQAWNLQRFVFGERSKIVSFKEYLKSFKYENDNYELTHKDIYYLLKIIATNDRLPLIQAVRKYFDSVYFFEVFNTLDNAGLINEKNFPTIYQLNYNERMLLQFLFCNREHIECKSETLELALLLGKLKHQSPEIVLKYLDLLMKKNLLNETTLKLLIDKSSDLHSLFQVIKELNVAQQLHRDNLKLLATVHSLYSLGNLLRLLNTSQFQLSEEIFAAICRNNNLTELTHIFELICPIDPLKINQEIIAYLLKNEVNSEKLYSNLTYLKNCNLLTVKSFQNFATIFLINPNHPLIDLLIKLNQANFYINKVYFKKLVTLSEHNLNRLDSIISDLIAAKLLDKHSLSEALQRITVKLPSTLLSSIVKKSWRDAGSNRSEFILDNKFNFFSEHITIRKYQRGGYGKVKKGYYSQDSDYPSYSIKKLNQADPAKSKEEAKREVKFNRLLGRNAYYFSHKGKTSVVSEWQHEKALHYFNAKDFLAVPFTQRLQCLISGLTDLDILHRHYRVHADVKCENFILDLKMATMKLIDFGASHKKRTTRTFAWTPEYRDHTLGAVLDYSFCDDMYAMGIVTAMLFPELYDVCLSAKNTNVILKKRYGLTVDNVAIIALVDSMMHIDRNMRCSSVDALEHCKEILNNIKHLDHPLLKKIIDSTLHRPCVTAEDTFRGKMQP